MVILSLKKWKSVAILGLVMLCYDSYAQEVTVDVNWVNINGEIFLENGFEDKNSGTLFFVDKIQVPSDAKISNVRFFPLKTTKPTLSQEINAKASKSFDDINWYIVTEKKTNFLKFEVPAYTNNNGLVRLEQFKISYSQERIAQKRAEAGFVNESKLANGKWFKISVSKSGVYKINYAFLKNLGVDVDAINPNNINVYGSNIGMLPLNNGVPRPDDLTLNAIKVVGESDGVFNKNDYILFYAKGPDTWKYDLNQNNFIHKKHDYSDNAHYFIGIGVDEPVRITSKSESTLTSNYSMVEFDDYQFHEKELTNLIGSGRIWMGDHLYQSDNLSFNFSFPNIAIGKPARVKSVVYGRTVGVGQNSQLSMNVEGRVQNYNVSGVAPFDENVVYAKKITDIYDFPALDANISVNVTHNGNATNDEAWVDYIAVNARRALTLVGSQMSFRDRQSVGKIAEMQLNSNISSVSVWEVTDVGNVFELNLRAVSGKYLFTFSADSLREFVAHTGSSYFEPEPVGEILNQNLHGLASANYIIITHPLFKSQAENLAAFHQERQGLSSHVINVFDVYNEFSSGTPDVTAIKDFLRMLYKRSIPGGSEELKYVLLFGDGSYNNRKGTSGNTNFIPTFQSFESLKATESFSSDDYFAFLDDTESYLNNELIDVGIGRFPVQNTKEAQDVVDKTKRYLTGDNQGIGKLNVGDWKNKICFVADDEDNNTHIGQSMSLTTKVDTEHNEFNVQKIFLDAYKQVSTPGGERYYEAQDDLREAVQKGSLLVNYTGHGGEVGWAHERVLDLTDIKGWTNNNRLPIFMTATCEFTRFDDPERTSAGEFVLLNPNGGGVALLSTTRVVYAGPNFELNKAFFNYAFEQKDGSGDINRLGEIVRKAKNDIASTSNATNHRNFGLFGDPAIPINFPRQKVVTTTINNKNIDLNADTLKALSKITITGEVRNTNDSLLLDFNGTVLPIVFGKSQQLQTLANDQGSKVVGFTVQNNIIYKGKVQVKNGLFSFSFVVPKDISSAFGNARISYYAWDTEQDGAGVENRLKVGGTADSVLLDDVAPEINLFLNDEQFVNGGLTNQNPVLLAKLYDDNGLNTVGTGIGHDLTAVLDGNVNDPIILNEYYEADLDAYQSGQVTYQLTDLSPGPHTLTFKAWDVYNNSSETKLEFIVANNDELILDHILNYPNPFTSFTDFYFEHNQPGAMLQVKLQVFTISGKLVKSFEQLMQTTGSRSKAIRWNGRDDFGDKIGRGTYVYKLRVDTEDGKNAQQFEKLVKF